MISDNQSICPKCGGQLKYYDHVQRLVRTKFGNKKWVAIRRLRCCKCHAVHRELPDFIFPYKQYEADIIIGVLEGLITCETLGFEDYPCEIIFASGSVPVAVAARVYGKDASWIRAGIVSGWLPIGKATRSGKLVTNLEEMNSKYGRINFYISPKLLWQETGYIWRGERA